MNRSRFKTESVSGMFLHTFLREKYSYFICIYYLVLKCIIFCAPDYNALHH